MSSVNVQALVALFLFVLCLVLSRMIVNISSGKWPGGALWVTYLRVLLGFLFAAAITLGMYSFAGIDFLNR
ncbi:MAG: flagellar biosynthesis protein FliR [Thermovirgaceae bacterium]|jgi:VIT1/CCC1 family predicted Fe2+/Mn2+ transporter|nr:flagellar biosynthesis protein FliR [Synergistales bacterium]MDI9391949.1 flagellar biosynthesis protein FliR [Synergistota bacterium]MDY0178427.1 flagellar biosynthesis protein FliR [Synergistaceae bacterium]HRW87454.1 flagellar biosynthesis protein FliR [Thermovirgaceae bacterium]MDD3133424.1 flagellar biosynthesis protein FliR [Synergistales bacterium]